MKKLFLIILFLIINLVLFISCGHNELGFKNGNGSIDDPFIIESYDDLFKINNVDFFYYQLNSDIDNTSNRSIDQSLGILNGVLNGNRHTISGIKITNSNVLLVQNRAIANMGLFSTMKYNSVIKDLKIQNIDIDIDYTEGKANIGTICGYIADESMIENVEVTGVISAKIIGGSIGGIAGNGGNINNAYSNVNITAESIDAGINVGGILGYQVSPIKKVMVQGTIIVKKGSNTSALNDTHYIGGITGSGKSSITNGINDTTIQYPIDENSTDSFKAVIGGISGTFNGSISDSITVGSIDANVKYDTVIGGISGKMTRESGIEFTFGLTNLSIEGSLGEDDALGAIVGSTTTILQYQMIYYTLDLGFENAFNDFTANSSMQFNHVLDFYLSGDIIDYFDDVFVFETGKIPKIPGFNYEYIHSLIIG